MKMNGTLFTPMNKDLAISITERYAVYEQQCLGSYSTSFWQGIRGDVRKNAWLILNSGDQIPEAMLDMFVPPWNKLTTEEQCVSSSIRHNGRWYTTGCNHTACAICSFDVLDPPMIRIYGLCKRSKVERKLTLAGIKNLHWKFGGDFGTLLSWNGNTWIIEDNLKIFKLTMLKPDGLTLYPIGRNEWYIDGDECSKTEVSTIL